MEEVSTHENKAEKSLTQRETCTVFQWNIGKKEKIGNVLRTSLLIC